MERARETIRNVLATAKSPAVLMSFGKDSMLLMSLVREVDRSVPAIWFRTGENEKFAKQVIMDWDLEVWSWEPSDVYVLPNENGLSLIREQTFGHHQFPVVLDIEEGQKCIGEFLQDRTPVLFPHFDAIFLGFKNSDYHWTLGGSGFCPEDGWELGRAKVFAPLRSMMDSDVWQATRKLGVPIDEERYTRGGADPSTVQACSACLQAGQKEVWCQKEKKFIPRVAWNPALSLSSFQERFGFKQVA